MNDLLRALNPHNWDHWVEVAARVVLTILLAWMLQRLGTRLNRVMRERIAARVDEPEQQRRAETLARVVRYLSSVVITLVAGMVVLGELGIPVAPIIGAAGVVGLAIGFGAQTLVKDYFNGFFLLLENQLARGEVVEVAGRSGTVEDVTLRHVQLRDYDGNLHFIPNSLITTVSNASRGHAFAVMDLAVSRGEDLARVYAVLADVAAGMRVDAAWSRRITGALEIAGVERLEAGAAVVRSRLRVHALEQGNVRREFLRRLQGELVRRGINAPDASIVLLPAPQPGGRSNTSTSD
jgi:small conductance mechanosensitive channel